MIRTIVKVDGMMCGMCEAHVNDAIRKNFDVEKVSSSHEKGETEILSKEPLDDLRLQKVIDDTGYSFKGSSSEPYEKKRFRLFGK